MDAIETIFCDDWFEFCDSIDRSLLQDSFLWRSTTIARELAITLINEEGRLDEKGMKRALFILETKGFSLDRERYHDAPFISHVTAILRTLENDLTLQNALKRIPKPFSHPLADKIIRTTLELQEHLPIKESHAKQAALAALLCSLRQNVGSCFATAPAIRIQKEYPVQLLTDIASLFGTGKLHRVHEGVEYSVPLSFSFGVGDLLKPFFLNVLGKNIVAILSTSYSLLLPLEKAGVIESAQSYKEKCAKLEALLKKSALLERMENEFITTTADELLQKLLQTHFKLSPKELENKEQRLSFGRLPILRGQKESQKERYQKAYQKAKQTFVAMTDNPLLKSWEFTLASLSESKADFAQWNLSLSLGLQPEEPSGIGRILYENIQKKIGSLNDEIEGLQRNYDQIFVHAKHIEARMQRSTTEKEQRWLLSDHNVRKLEIDHVLRQRDEAYDKANKLRELLPFMLRFYQEKFKDYFQEIYDPEMHDLTLSPYDDSPAGFRLLYKHGRSNPSLWTYIYTAEEYSEALLSFFTATESELRHREEVEGVEKELSELVTACLLAIREESFLEASFYRLGKAYGEAVVTQPLLHQEQVKRKPWAYVSGGTMTTLLSCYYRLSTVPREETRWVESVSELFAFYLDTLKALPLSAQNYFLSHRDSSLLAFSPTHAFLLMPGYPLFRKGWQSDNYSYTWIRDEVVTPATKFIASIELDSEMMLSLSTKICEQLPLGYRHIVYQKLSAFTLSMTPSSYRQEALQLLSYEKWLQGGRVLEEIGDHIDAVLYESLPFSFAYELEKKVEALCMEVDDIGHELYERVKVYAQKEQAARARYELISAKELMAITKSLLVQAIGSNRVHVDLHLSLQKAMHRMGYALREPVLFGDTNWVKNRFGFCVNPGTLALELWRFDVAGSSGRPMSIWKEHVDGRSKKKWGLLTNLSQYGELFMRV